MVWFGFLCLEFGIEMYGVVSYGMVKYAMVWYGLASCVAPTAGDDGGSTPVPPTAPNTPEEQTSHQTQTEMKILIHL